MIGKTISHYKILEKLGEGGMGVVYKAEDTKLDRIVALKFLPFHLTKSDTDIARFLQEAKAAAALNHPNVCTIHEIHDEGENPFIVMEYVQGLTLREKIKNERFKIKDTIDYAIQIAEALKAAHSKGIVHRDIKSDNIMVMEDDRVKVMDFGLAKLKGSMKLTKSSSTMGTLAYMAPEHLQGQEVDARTDIFSFGVVLYEMLTGQLPFKGEYDSAMMYSILNDEPEPVQKYRSDLPSELLHVLNRALEKDPEERYQSVNDMLIDLKRLKRDTDRVSRKTPTEFPSEEMAPAAESTERKKSVPYVKPKKRARTISLLIAVAIIVAVVISVIFIMKTADSKYVENRIVVVPFENNTGDESLDIMGKMAAEMITQNISQVSFLEAVPFISVRDAYSKREESPSAYTVAEQNRAGVLITGSYYLQDENLFFQVSMMDVAQEKLLESLPPVKGSDKTKEVIFEKLCDKIMGTLAVHFSFDLPVVHTHIPSFEAYKEFMIGFELFGVDYDQARSHFRKAVEIDSEFTTALVYTATSYSNQGEWARADSIYDILNKRREELAEFDRIILDWGMANTSGNDAKAMRFLKKAEELAPESITIQYLIGLYAVNMNHPQLTVNTFEKTGSGKITQSSSGSRSWWFNVLTEAFYMLGEYDEALDVINTKSRYYPDSPSNLSFEAILRAARGEIQEVYRIIDESFRLSSEAPKYVMMDAAWGLRAHGHKQASHKVCKRALEWYQSRPDSDDRYSIARLLYWDEQWLKAQEYFEQLSREYPDNLNYRGYVGVTAARLGEQDKANMIFKELYNKDEPYLFGSHLHWCARIAAVLGNKKHAVDLLRETYGRGYGYGIYELLIMDFECLKDYEPYIELMRPKG
jgi:serine/threonine protein kinase